MTANATFVHPTAIVGSDVQLAAGVSVGPYCVIEGRVSIGTETQVLAHTLIMGTTRIGSHCRIGPHAALGGDPQHLGYKGDETWLVIGDHVQVREFVSVNRAFHSGEENATRIGNNCLLMSNVHVAHDCVIGQHVTLATNVMLGGHVHIGDRAFLGGGAGIHQFVRIGRLAMVGGLEQVHRDVLPFGMIRFGGHRAYNAVGLRRSGVKPETAFAIRSAFTYLLKTRNIAGGAEALASERADSLEPEVREMVEFARGSKRGIMSSSDISGID